MARGSRICPCEGVGTALSGPEGARLVVVLRQYAPSWLGQLPALLPPAEWEAPAHGGSCRLPRMLRGVTDALDAFTTACPLVLGGKICTGVDRATLAWLEVYVARRPDPARLLILGTYRPVEAMVQVIHYGRSSPSSGSTASVWSWSWSRSPKPR